MHPHHQKIRWHMFEFLRNLMGNKASNTTGGGNSFRVEAYDIRSPIKLPKPIQTPLGGRVTVVRPVVNIDYRITQGQVELLRVAMSQTGGSIPGSSMRLNIVADKTGEAFFVSHLEPESLLYEHVMKDVLEPSSYLRSHMFSVAGLDTPQLRSAPRMAVAEDSPPSSLRDEMVRLAGMDGFLSFTYHSPTKGAERRVVTVQRFDGDGVWALDHKDSKRKRFLLSRISEPTRPD